MKRFVFAFVFCCLNYVAFCQSKFNCNSFIELLDGMQSVDDTIYIGDRHKLQKLEVVNCNIGYVRFELQVQGIYLTIAEKPFDNLHHVITPPDTVFKWLHGEKRIDYFVFHDLIDGKRAWGIDGTIPKREIALVYLSWGNKVLSIPASAFHNLYEPSLCHLYMPAEAYFDSTRDLIYVYFNGSDGAGSYSAKLVFSKQGYVTRLITTFEIADHYNFLDNPCRN